MAEDFDGPFDAKAEATKIRDMVSSCLDDNSDGRTIKAANTETAIAKELASIWGKPDKLEAVASEFQSSAPRAFTRVDLGDKPTDVVGFDFRNFNLIRQDFVMNAKKIDEDVVVTVGPIQERSARKDGFTPKFIDYTVTSPISHEK